MEILSTIFTLVIFAVLTEFVVNVIKGWLPEVALKYIKPPLLAAIIGLVLAFAFQLDIFSMLGYETPWAYVAFAVTGIIVSAGSVPVHELIAKLRESRAGLDDSNEPLYYTNTITNIPPEGIETKKE